MTGLMASLSLLEFQLMTAVGGGLLRAFPELTSR